jgi:sulfonate transport system permease protein
MSSPLFHNPKFTRWATWIGPVLLLTLWELITRFGWITARILPEPSAVLAAALHLLQTGELQEAFLASARRAFLGFLFGGSLGVLMGLITGLSQVAEVLLDGTFQMLRNVPLLAIMPMVILWFGIGEEAKVFIISLAVFFPLYLNTYFGIRSIDPNLLQMGRVYHLSPWRLFSNIILPGALPTILLGVRYGLTFMWLVLIVAETLSATSGIGYIAENARTFLQTDRIVLTIVIYAFLGKLSETIARKLEAWLLPWHHTQSRSSCVAV